MSQTGHSHSRKVDCDQTLTQNSEGTFDIQSKYKAQCFWYLFIPGKNREKHSKSEWEVGAFHTITLCDL